MCAFHICFIAEMHLLLPFSSIFGITIIVITIALKRKKNRPGLLEICLFLQFEFLFSYSAFLLL